MSPTRRAEERAIELCQELRPSFMHISVWNWKSPRWLKYISRRLSFRFWVTFVATKFATACTNYEHLDVMFWSVNKLQPQVFNTHELPQMLGQHWLHHSSKAWFCLMFAHALVGAVLHNCYRYTQVLSDLETSLEHIGCFGWNTHITKTKGLAGYMRRFKPVKIALCS